MPLFGLRRADEKEGRAAGQPTEQRPGRHEIRNSLCRTLADVETALAASVVSACRAEGPSERCLAAVEKLDVVSRVRRELCAW